MTIYCRAETRADADALLPGALSLYDEDGNPRNYAQDGDTIVDVIGPYMVSPAVYGEDGETVITPADMDERFHFNVYNHTASVAGALSGVTIPTPANPLRGLA